MIRIPLTAVIATVALVFASLVAPTAVHARDYTISAPGPMAWSPDGQYVYVGIGEFFTPGSGVIKRVNLSDGTVSDVVTMTDPASCHAYVNALAITPDGNTLYAGGYSCVMTIDLTATPISYTSSYTGNDWVQKIVVGSNAAYAVFPEGGAVYKTTKTGSTWGSVWTQLVGRTSVVTRSAALSADGATLYVGSEGGNVRVINTVDGTETFIAGTGPSVVVAADPHGNYLLVLDGSRGITRVQLTGPNAGTITSASSGSDSGLRRIAIDTSGNYAYLGAIATRAILKMRTSDLSIVDSTNLGTAYPTLVSLNRSAPDDLLASPILGSNGVVASSIYLNKILSFPMVPTAPLSLTATSGDSSAEISFTAAQDGLSTISNYEYSINGSGTWTALSPGDATSPVTVSGLTNGAAASIQLRAVNAIGNGAASSAVNVTPLGVPSAPRSVSVTTSMGQASISFTAPANDGGAAITNYEFTTNGGGSWTPMSPATTTPPFVITGLSNGTSYPFAVRAVNSYGAGASSTVVTASTPSLPGGGSTVSEPTPSPSPTASSVSPSLAALVSAPVQVTEVIPAGESLIVVNGVTTRVAVNVVQGRTWQIKGADFTLEFTPQASLGNLDGTFTARAGTKVQVQGDGFLPGSLIASYLPGALADSLGKATVNSDSTFNVVAALPADLAAGQYVFQVNGLSSATTVRSVNLGLQLLAAEKSARTVVSKRVMFSTQGSVMTANAKKSVSTWLSTHKESASSALVVPTVKKGASAEAKSLALKRAQNVRSSLRMSGFTKPIRIATKIRVADDASADRRTTVWLRLA